MIICAMALSSCSAFHMHGMVFYNTSNENRKYELHAVQVHLKYDIDI